MEPRPRARVDVKSVDLESELLIYDERRRLVHLLNSTARRIWQLCDGVHGVDEIAREVQRLFPQAPVERVHHDVQETLSALVAKDVIVWIAEEVGRDVGTER